MSGQKLFEKILAEQAGGEKEKGANAGRDWLLEAYENVLNKII